MNHLLGQINADWRPHEHHDDEDRPGDCLAVGIDPRYLPDESGGVTRMMVTFGPNPYLGIERGVLIPCLPCEYVFGIHMVGVKGDTVTVYDQWFDAIPADGPGDVTRLGEVMAAMPDERVFPVVSHSASVGQRLELCPVTDLDRLTLGRGG